MAQNGPTGRTIQSDERLFDIIECLTEADTAGVTEIAEAVGLTKGTVHGHLTALRRRGYVVKDGTEYRLGLEFLFHGKNAQLSYELYSISRKKVDQLADQTGERVACMVEENGWGYYLYRAEGQHPVQPPVQLGEGVTLHPRSAGKAILAYLPPERVEEIIDRHGLPAETDQTITNRETLSEELREIRRRGYAINDEESIPGLYAIAAPIIDNHGDVRGALTISGPANRLRSEDSHRQLIDLLLGATNELEINLTYS